MRQNKPQLDYTSGLTALCSVAFWLTSVFTGMGLRLLLPDSFDGLPLLLILVGAMALACLTNRTLARSFARSHFGIPPSERREMLERHMEECKADPDAVLARYKDMETLPTAMLVLYYVLSFAIGVSAPLCLVQPTS